MTHISCDTCIYWARAENNFGKKVGNWGICNQPTQAEAPSALIQILMAPSMSGKLNTRDIFYCAVWRKVNDKKLHQDVARA